MKHITIIIVLIVLYIPVTGISADSPDEINITIIYDNYIFQKGTESDWGFSCFIETKEETILFDTGTHGEILKSNAEKLNIDFRTVDIIVLSHIHRDHTGGLMTVLDINNDLSVYYPYSFPQEFNKNILLKDAVPVAVKEPLQINDNIYLTGEIKGPVNEQSLILNTAKGLIIIAGCSHPGIVKIVKKAKEIVDNNIYLVLGGFHLMNHSEAEVQNIAEEFKKMGVEKCGATHCTGDQAIGVFKDEFGDDYIPMGVGKTISID